MRSEKMTIRSSFFRADHLISFSRFSSRPYFENRSGSMARTAPSSSERAAPSLLAAAEASASRVLRRFSIVSAQAAGLEKRDFSRRVWKSR